MSCLTFGVLQFILAQPLLKSNTKVIARHSTIISTLIHIRLKHIMPSLPFNKKKLLVGFENHYQDRLNCDTK